MVMVLVLVLEAEETKRNKRRAFPVALPIAYYASQVVGPLLYAALIAAFGKLALDHAGVVMSKSRDWEASK